EDSLFNLEDDNNKQELNEDNQLKCCLFDNYLLIREIENLALKNGSIECCACTGWPKTYLNYQLASLQHDYDKAKTQIDIAHTQC
ncbi:unnamed protein product, partial [Rotaria sordida]